MTPQVVDPVAPIVSRMLSCLLQRLDLYDVPVCRSVWSPTPNATWDACGETDDGAEGQAWVAVASPFVPTDDFPNQTAGAHRCVPVEYAADLIVGVLRCAATVDDRGEPPSEQAVTTDAVKQSRDRQIALEAILCCYVTEDTDPGVFRLGSWEPLGPQGGCVGGQWRVTVRVPACPCPPEVP